MTNWCPKHSAPCFDVRCDECPHRLTIVPRKLLTYRPKVFLDMDGVLANFDKRAEEILSTNNIYKYEFVHGPEVFWHKLNKYPNFFMELELMPDAGVLLNAVWHLDPIVLTALPKTNGDRVRQHKEAWVALNLKEGMKVICCQTHEKPHHCNPGDVLIDDRAVNRQAWEAKGGRYIVHTSAEDSVAQLKELKVI